MSGNDKRNKEVSNEPESVEEASRASHNQVERIQSWRTISPTGCSEQGIKHWTKSQSRHRAHLV